MGVGVYERGRGGVRDRDQGVRQQHWDGEEWELGCEMEAVGWVRTGLGVRIGAAKWVGT